MKIDKRLALGPNQQALADVFQKTGIIGLADKKKNCDSVGFVSSP
jgi:hypothetical protein